MKIRKIVFGLAALIFAVCILLAVQHLLMPKYMGKVVEGSFIEEYYERPADHDVLILGDCEVYENISPVKLWNEYGISGFIRGSAQQLIPQSYYLLEEALKYETPKAVILSISAMQQIEQTSETYNRMTLDGMRWSGSKWNAILSTKMEDEHMIEYLFPLLRFHSRFSDLNADDFQYYFRKARVSYAGYYLRADVRPVGDFPRERRLENYAFEDKGWDYLERIRTLCDEHDIQLILMKAPSLYPAWHDQWDSQIVEYAAEHDLLYINCIDHADEIGIDFSTDTYDGGLHMNVYGAEKMSVYLGNILKDIPGISDRRDNEADSAYWAAITASYEQEKAAQQEEFANTGFLKRFQ